MAVPDHQGTAGARVRGGAPRSPSGCGLFMRGGTHRPLPTRDKCSKALRGSEHRSASSPLIGGGLSRGPWAFLGGGLAHRGTEGVWHCGGAARLDGAWVSLRHGFTAGFGSTHAHSGDCVATQLVGIGNSVARAVLGCVVVHWNRPRVAPGCRVVTVWSWWLGLVFGRRLGWDLTFYTPAISR